MTKKIIVHTLVKNEENYIWFSVGSVIDYVDKVFIWDTGSSDKTVEIIHEIEKKHPGKVYFKEVGNVDINEFTSIRQGMLDESDCDWIILVDGDEVWWDEKIRDVISIINDKGDQLDSIVTKYINLVGDIYHFQADSVGRYNIDSHRGFLTVRAMNRRIDGLNVGKPHGQQGFFNGQGNLVQHLDPKKRVHIDGFTNLHFTNLIRSSSGDEKVPKRIMKHKFELGESFLPDFYYPEIFFKPRPKIVPSPWQNRDAGYVFRAELESPLKCLKRSFLTSNKSGY